MKAPELAQHSEVLQVYASISTWLEENGEYNIDESREFVGHHLGKLVVDGMEPAFDFHLAGAALDNHAPLMHDSFELANTEPLSFYHTPEHYTVRSFGKPGDPDRVLPHVRFIMHAKRPQSKFSRTDLELIHDPDANMLYIQRRHDVRGSTTDNPSAYELLFYDFVSEKILQGEPDSVTRDEFRGLQQLDHMLHSLDIDTLRDEEPWQDTLLQKITDES